MRIENTIEKVAAVFPRLSKEVQILMAGMGIGVGTVCIGILIGWFVVN